MRSAGSCSDRQEGADIQKKGNREGKEDMSSIEVKTLSHIHTHTQHTAEANTHWRTHIHAHGCFINLKAKAGLAPFVTLFFRIINLKG